VITSSTHNSPSYQKFNEDCKTSSLSHQSKSKFYTPTIQARKLIALHTTPVYTIFIFQTSL